MLSHEDFTLGAHMGSAPVTLDEALFARWIALFPADAGCRPRMPPGMTAVVLMNAYMTILAERPPGNVHAAQSFSLTRLPSLGDTVTTTLGCTGKRLSKGRRWVDLHAETVDSTGALLFTGTMLMLWAQ